MADSRKKHCRKTVVDFEEHIIFDRSHEVGEDFAHWGGESFRMYGVAEEKCGWLCSLDSQLKQGPSKTYHLFVGQKYVNRFVWSEHSSDPDESDKESIRDLAVLHRYLSYVVLKRFKNVDKSSHPKHNKNELSRLAQQRSRAYMQWRREEWFPDVLKVLEGLISRHRHCSSFMVFGSRSDQNLYIRQMERKLKLWNRRSDRQKELESEILKGEWPSISVRLSQCFRDELSVAKSIHRAIRKGHKISDATRLFFKLCETTKRLGHLVRAA
jgi:hypothetical protein